MEKNIVYSPSTSNTREYGTGKYHKMKMAYNNVVIVIEIIRSMMECFPLSFVFLSRPNMVLKNPK